MPFSSRQLGLIGSALLLTLLMLTVVPLVTRSFSPMTGYVAVLAIYWLCFCVPVAVYFGTGKTQVSLDLRSPTPWIPVLAIALPVAVFLAAGPFRWFGSNPGILMLAVTCAVINGPLEELAWRRTFRANSDKRLSFEALGLGLFTLWHVPLFFSSGVTFDHGALGLIGGALVLGSVWMMMTRASNSVGWPVLSHALVNVGAFLPFFVDNFAD